MRPAPSLAASPVYHVKHTTPDQFTPIQKSETNYTYNPRLRTYYDSDSFEANLAVILVVLICALICALVLNSAIRCFLTGSRSSSSSSSQTQQKGRSEDERVDVERDAAITTVFSNEVKLAGTEAECAICLSEFVVGEEIKVLRMCKHGFHLGCIHKWLHSQSSCPTCRTCV